MISKTPCALWSKLFMQPSTPLHPQIADMITKLLELVTQREQRIAEAIMELQKEEFNKARVIQLLS